jgi:hypothetical protein
MIEEKQITVIECTCERCKAKWICNAQTIEEAENIKQCGVCHNSYWNKPRK